MELPMPEPTVSPLPLQSYQVLSFDVYGSLIEYKAHILKSFAPLLGRLPASSPYLDSTPLASNVPGSATKGSIEFLKKFQAHEDAIKLELGQHPRRFDDILREIWRRIAADIGVSTTDDETNKFGSEENVASWPTFEGTFEALQSLSKHFKLIALSNIDRFAWSITASSPNSKLGNINWWKVFSAEDFGDDLKKADDAKLETMLSYCEENGINKDEILHVAQSLGHDHAPAKRAGLSSVFLIGDGPVWGKEAESKMALEKGLVGYGWRCKDLAEFAELVEKSSQG
jgi:FMN phosphatase YigB (HAD superfamily)